MSDLSELYAILPQKLIEGQKALEQAIQAFGEAADLEAAAEYEYRVKKGEVLRRMREEKMAVGLAVELAQAETADGKRKVMEAEGKKKKCMYLIDGYRERLFNLRKIGDSVSRNMGNL